MAIAMEETDMKRIWDLKSEDAGSLESDREIELGPGTDALRRLRPRDIGDSGNGKAFSPVFCSCILGMGHVPHI
jgi:hypothetical protein